jgi:GNAT superfamily N-acetyltransferase
MIESTFTIKQSTYKIRPMILADLPEVKIIRDQCLPFIHDKVSYDLPATMEWLKTTESKYLSVIDESGMVIGYFRLTDISKDHCFVGMDLHQDHRGKGIATKVLSELESWAKEENYKTALLETGFMQKDAIYLYQKLGYKIIENFGQYQGVENSICMKKNI